MKIYTRTGDRGKTSLFDNTRVWKDSVRVETYGTIDELNSVLGIIASELEVTKKPAMKKLLYIVTQIQRDLFSLGSSLATPGSVVLEVNIKKRIEEFEKTIDEVWKKC